MAVVGIKRSRIILSIPEATYESVKKRATQKEMTVPRYIKFLVDQDIIKNGLPLYCSEEILIEK